MEENKLKTTIIQMLIEIQNHLNKIDLESNSIQKFEPATRKSNRKLNIHKTDELKCSIKYERLYRDDNDGESCNSYNSSAISDSSTSSDESFDEILSGNIQKKKNQKISTKSKGKNTVIKENYETSKNGTSKDKERVI